MTAPTSTQPTELPATIRAFLAAHDVRDAEAALATFGPSAVVVDDGATYRGTDEVRHFLTHAGSEFTYTVTPVRAQRLDDSHWVVTRRLEGDFPGGVVELAYRFVMDGDRIVELVIGA